MLGDVKSVSYLGGDYFGNINAYKASLLGGDFTNPFSVGMTSITKNGKTARYYFDSIGASAFASKAITALYINSSNAGVDEYPYYISEIGEGAFKNCTSMTTMVFKGNKADYPSIGAYAFMGCTALSSVTLHPKLRSLGDGAFEGCTSLTSISIPDTCQTIGADAFKNCTSLSTVTIPSGVISIGDNAFEGCTSLTSIVIPDSVRTIGAGAFKGCTKLATVKLSSSISVIPDELLSGCVKLTSLTAPSTIKSIGQSAFNGCALLDSFSIPSGVTAIGEQAFRGCASLTRVSVPTGVKAIERYTFEGCTNLTDLSMPSNVDYIGDGAFKNCSKLVGILMPKGINALNEEAFSGCSQLTKICVSEGVTAIYRNAFSGCTALKKIYLPKTLLRIEELAFGNDSAQVVIDQVYYGGTETQKSRNLSIAGLTSDDWGNGHLSNVSEWLFGQTENAFQSGNPVSAPVSIGGNGSSGYDGESEENTGAIYYDYEYKNPVEYSEPVRVVANAPKTPKNGGVGSVVYLYTDITPTYTFTYNGRKVIGKTGKVVAGITMSPEKPYVLGGKKIFDAQADRIATAKCNHGVIEIKAKKEPGLVYLHVIDTGSSGKYACIPVDVQAAPTKLKVFQGDSEIKEVAVPASGSVLVEVKAYYTPKSGGEEEINGADISFEFKGSAAGYYKVEEQGTGTGMYQITSLSKSKGAKGSVVFISTLTNKKVDLGVRTE